MRLLNIQLNNQYLLYSFLNIYVFVFFNLLITQSTRKFLVVKIYLERQFLNLSFLKNFLLVYSTYDIRMAFEILNYEYEMSKNTDFQVLLIYNHNYHLNQFKNLLFLRLISIELELMSYNFGVRLKAIGLFNVFSIF